MKKFLALSLSDILFIMLINVKMATIIGNLTFISMIFYAQLIKPENILLPSGLYSKHVPIVPVLEESWSGQVNSGPW